MPKVVHRTPGLLPIEATTGFGVHAKPNSNNPIGHFGTGLKYAIAVLLREGCKIQLFIGTTEYVFYTKVEDFRGTPIEYVRMKQRNGLLSRWTYTKLPFTLALGKNWELWQAYRELHSNTLDEGGYTFLGETYSPEEDTTLFVIDSPKYVDIFHDRDRIFLPDGLKERTSNESIQVLDRPSKHIYYRGLRIMDLKKEAQFTYNFLSHTDLTEDRTAKFPHMLEAQIVGYMQESKDEAFLEKAVAKPKPGSYESGLHHGSAYTSSWGAPSVGVPYLAAAQKSTLSTAKEVWDQNQPTIKTTARLTIVIPRPGVSAEALREMSAFIDNQFPDAYIIDEDGKKWSPRIKEEDDIQF